VTLLSLLLVAAGREDPEPLPGEVEGDVTADSGGGAGEFSRRSQTTRLRPASFGPFKSRTTVPALFVIVIFTSSFGTPASWRTCRARPVA
jgi:hypothetical protein